MTLGFKDGEQPADVGAGGGTSGQGAGVMGAQGWDKLMAGIDIPSTLSANGKKFIDDLREYFKNDPAGLVLHSISNDRIAGAAILSKDNNYAIVIGLGESYSITDKNPPTYALTDLTIQLTQKYPGIKVLQGILLFPEDYDRLQRTAAAIKTSLQISVNHDWGRSFNHTTFARTESSHGSEMFITSDMTRINAFIDKFSPHAVPARADFGFGVIIRDKTSKRKNLMHQDSSGEIAIAVTAYMDFVPIGKDQAGYPTQFEGLIKISNIVSAVAHKNLYALLYPIIVAQFIENRGWHKPYRKDWDTINIGNLVPNTEGGHYQITSEKEWFDFMAAAIPQEKIAIAFEIDDSRFRIAGSDMLTSNPNLLVQAITDFYGLTEQGLTEIMSALKISAIPQPFLFDYAEVIGQVNNDGKPQDSREWDYLKMAKMFPDPQRIQQFFYRSASDPFSRNSLLENTGCEVKPTGTCTSVVINPNFANWVCHLLNATELGRGGIEYEYNEQLGMYQNGINLAGAGGYGGHGGMLHNAASTTPLHQGGSPYRL